MSSPSQDSSAPGEIAIFGGSFDPPHLGHVFLAAYALSRDNIERVLVLPVHQHAFGKPLSPFAHRFEMCRLAFRDLRRVEVSDLERELGGVSRTLRLIEALEQRYPKHRLRTLVGADILSQRASWQNFDEIERRAPLLVAGRGGHDLPDTYRAPLLPEISSTELRKSLARDEFLDDDKIPCAVARYARDHKLYEADA